MSYRERYRFSIQVVVRIRPRESATFMQRWTKARNTRLRNDASVEFDSLKQARMNSHSFDIGMPEHFFVCVDSELHDVSSQRSNERLQKAFISIRDTQRHVWKDIKSK